MDRASAGEARLRLHYLDGLRGLAALYVVLHHALMEVVEPKGWLSPSWVAATRWAWNGQIAVQIFIVLSGYCLMMPVVRSGVLKDGVVGFIGRRARRILPPYYAALAFALAVTLFVPGMNVPQGLRWDITLPALTPGVLGSHLLLLQDLRSDWIFKINYPMWTIAQEWQIYFVFALVLLPLWRRVGIVPAVGVAFGLSCLARRLPGGYDLTYAAPEFLFLFSVGMGAACLNFGAAASRWQTAKMRFVWPAFSLGFALAYVALMLRRPELTQIHSWRLTLLAAAAMLGTLVWCTNSARNGDRRNFLLRLCDWEPVVVLGTFSYSLYLVHAPILSMVALVMRRAQTSGPVAVAIELLAAVPVATLFAYGFHLLVERPFMPGRPKTLRQDETAAVLAPAP